MKVPEPNSLAICVVDGRAVTLGEIAPVLKIEGRWSLVEEAIREVVLDEAGIARGIVVGDEELQREADDFRGERKLYSGADTDKWLRANHMSLDDLEKGLMRRLVVAKLRGGVDDEEVRRYFFDHLKSFQWARFCQIVVSERDAAEELLAQIRDDEATFTELARRHSIEEVSRQAGGYAGTVKRHDLSPQLEEVVFSAPLEALLGPIETAIGWHLLEVWERGGDKFDEQTAAAARDAFFERWLKGQIARVRLEVKL